MLDVKLDGETVIIATRTFAAPPEAVFDAHTRADLLQKWMTGPEGWTMPVCDCDARPGGKLHCTWAMDDQSFSLLGEFREIERPHRIVHIERWQDADMPDTEIVTTFEPRGTGTLMTLRMTYASPEARDAALKSGMTEGMAASYDRIDGLTAAA